jgi:excinuclease UvrABC nuclease subunit
MLELSQVNSLPLAPGVYKFYDINQCLLYIGKATCLRNRVKSYFNQAAKSSRVAKMVQQIGYIEFTPTTSELAARTLENNLIILLKPQFNILFKEEAKFPLIQLTLDPFPQIELAAQASATGLIFGPYPSKRIAQQLIKVVQLLLQLRECGLAEFKRRSSPCLNFQFKLCSAPCVKKISLEDYQTQVKQAQAILRLDFHQWLPQLKQKMQAAAAAMEFELAASYRDGLELLHQLASQRIIHPRRKLQNFDVLCQEVKSNLLFILVVIVRNGIYIGNHQLVLNHTSNQELINFLVNRYSQNANLDAVFMESTTKHQLRLVRQKLQLPSLKITTSSRQCIIKQLSAQATTTLQQIITNYNYTTLFAGGVSQLQHIFTLPPLDRVWYLNFSHDTLHSLEWNPQANDQFKLTNTLSWQPDVTLLRTKLQQIFAQANAVSLIAVTVTNESLILEVIRQLNLSFNILLIKPIPHQRPVLIRLINKLEYTSAEIVTTPALAKLVNLLAAKL